MSEQTFIDEINATIDNLNENLFGPRILYDMCNDKLHPWGDEAQLRDKLCFFSRVYEHPLREGFLHFAEREVGGKKFSHHRKVNVFDSIARILFKNELYHDFIARIADMGWAFSFDGSMDDMNHLRESLFAILEFNALLANAVVSYDELYHQPSRDRRNHYAFASKFLHFHRPKQFFNCNGDVYRGMMRFHHGNGCRIGTVVIDDRAKEEIFESYNQVMRFLEAVKVWDGERQFSPKSNLILMMAHQYAICCYFTAHKSELNLEKLQQPASLPLLASELLSGVKRLKTVEEIETIAKELKLDMPIEKVIDYCEDMVEFEEVLAALHKL